MLSEMAVDRFTFNEWLLSKHENFTTFTIEEIAMEARVSGYSEEEVRRWMEKKNSRSIT